MPILRATFNAARLSFLVRLPIPISAPAIAIPLELRARLFQNPLRLWIIRLDRIRDNGEAVFALEHRRSGPDATTGTPAIVYMQNSGLGNVVNPIASIADAQVSGIPMVFSAKGRVVGISKTVAFNRGLCRQK